MSALQRKTLVFFWSDFCKDKKVRLVFTSGKHVFFFGSGEFL